MSAAWPMKPKPTSKTRGKGTARGKRCATVFYVVAEAMTHNESHAVMGSFFTPKTESK